MDAIVLRTRVFSEENVAGLKVVQGRKHKLEASSVVQVRETELDNTILEHISERSNNPIQTYGSPLTLRRLVPLMTRSTLRLPLLANFVNPPIPQSASTPTTRTQRVAPI